jgi:hypothetical protein
MDINSLGGDFNAFVSQLKSLGVVVTASSADYGIVEGDVPIAELPTKPVCRASSGTTSSSRQVPRR